MNRQTTCEQTSQSGPNTAGSSKPLPPPPNQAVSSLQGVESEVTKTAHYAHRATMKKTAERLPGRGDSWAWMAITITGQLHHTTPRRTPHNADTPRHSRHATATTGAGEKRKRGRGAAPHLVITVRLAPPHNHGGWKTNSAK